MKLIQIYLTQVKKMVIQYFIFKYKIVLFSIFYSTICFCQNNEKAIYASFDKLLGKNNLEYFNGAIHINNDRTVTGKHRYFENQNFELGEIEFNNQLYSNLYLKYDIYNENVVLNLEENYNNSGLNIIAENLSYFVINNKRFVNSNKLESFPENLRKGFYQEVKISENITLYIKYLKKKSEVIKDTSILLDYNLQNDFILRKNGTYYNHDSKKEISKIFVNSRNKIDKYYKEKSAIEKENKVLFMIELIKILSFE